MQNIIIFGASGDIGSYLTDYVLSKLDTTSYNIIAVGTRDIKMSSDINYIRLDITKKEEFEKLPNSDNYAVVHLAGLMPARMRGYHPQKYIDINITGTLNILEYCRQTGVDRILFSQSFGDIKNNAINDIYLRPNSPKNFSYTTDHSVYVISKNTAIELIEQYHQKYGLKRFIFRLPTIYLYANDNIYYVDGEERPIGYRLLIEKAIKGDPIEIWGDPTKEKDMIYVKDCCQMFYKALFVNRDEGFYNVGTGIGISLENQIRGIIDIFSDPNNKSKVSYLPNKESAPQYIMDISNAISELGYSPKYSYLDMLKDYKEEMFKQ